MRLFQSRASGPGVPWTIGARRLVRWLLVLAIVFVAMPACAHTVTVCVDVDTNYSLVGGGDYITTNSVDVAGRGFKVTLENSSNVSVGTVTVAEGGLTPGCGVIPGSISTGSYHLKLEGIATVGSSITLIHDATGITRFSNHTVTGDTTIAETVTSSVPYDQLAAMAWAVSQHDGGLSSETIHIDNDSCCSYDGDVQLGASTENKYLIVETLGYAIAALRSGGVSTGTLADADDCDGGPNWLRKKYQSKAIVDGIATWYALITWNDKDDEDCEFRGTATTIDFDLDGTSDFGSGDSITCLGTDLDASFDPPTDGIDWLHDLVTNSDGSPDCDDEENNRSSDWDWWVYLWNMYSKGSGDPGDGLTASAVCDIFADVDPSTWDENEGTGGTSDDPWELWAASVIDLELDTESDPWAPSVDH